MKLFILTFFNCFILFSSLFSEQWIGKASVYFLPDGSKTASGAFFKQDENAVACNSFKFGSVVKVTNIQNGRSVDAVVNDRISVDQPFFLLLTQEVARNIEMKEKTSLIFVDAKKSDILEKNDVFIDGLTRESSLDPEVINQFPDIDLSSLDKKQPETETTKTPEKEQEKTEQIVDTQKTENEKEIENKEKETVKVKETEQKEVTETDVGKTIENLVTETIEKTAIPDIHNMLGMLTRNKLYIQFSTHMNQQRASEFYYFVSQIFSDITVVKKTNKFVFYYGPVSSMEKSKIINIIRNWGFFDAFVYEVK